MNIAYLILAHCDPKQLHNEVSELLKSGDVFIHINKKNDIEPFYSELAEYKDNSRVQFVNNRVVVNWGGYSILQATFSTLKQCLNNKLYDRIVLLTGLDFPVKNSTFIKDFFIKNQNIEFLTSDVVTGRCGILKHYAYFDNKFWFRYLRIIPGLKCFSFLAIKDDYVTYKKKKYNIYGITPKWALTGSNAQKLLIFFEDDNQVNNYFKSTYAPDDYYVATVIRIIGISENNICNDSLFYEKSDTANVGVTILNVNDFKHIFDSKQLFARKFDSTKSSSLLEKLNSEILN